MSTGKAKSGFSIEVTCPGCGAELELQENFFVLTCTHCGSCLRIIVPNERIAYLIKGRLPRNEIRFHIDRLLKEKKLPLSGSDLEIKSLYYPFWKIDAMVVRVRNRIERREIRPPSDYNDGQYVEHQKSSVTVSPYSNTIAAGSRIEGVPVSLGMRSEYLKLYPYSEEAIQESFDCLPVVRSPENVRTNMVMNMISVGETDMNAVGINRTELFHPKYSLVFFPYYIVESCKGDGYSRYLLDGVSGRILHYQFPGDEKRSWQQSGEEFRDGGVFETLSEELWDDSSCEAADGEIEATNNQPIRFGSLGVEFHRCPTCGEDLPGRQSHMYICRNCQEPVMLERSLFPLKGIWQTSVDQRRGDRLFPFWSFKIPEAQTPTIRRLFGGLFSSEQLVIPAFAMPNFEAMYRLAKRMSAASPRLELVTAESIDKRFVPVDIGMNSALTTAGLVIYREMLRRSQDASPEDVQFSPDEASLFFASFHPQSYFYVDSSLGAVTFEKSLVR